MFDQQIRHRLDNFWLVNPRNPRKRLDTIRLVHHVFQNLLKMKRDRCMIYLILFQTVLKKIWWTKRTMFNLLLKDLYRYPASYVALFGPAGWTAPQSTTGINSRWFGARFTDRVERLPSASELRLPTRAIDIIAALPGIPPPNPRVCFLCQRPRIIDISQFEPQRGKKRGKREIILSVRVGSAVPTIGMNTATIYPGVADR